MGKMDARETPSTSPDNGSWFAKRKQVLACTAAALALAGTATACGPEIGGTMGTGKYSVGSTELVIRNSNGEVLISSVGSDGDLKDNRYGWSNTTIAQATLAGLATNNITELPSHQVKTICTGDDCKVGTVLTTTGSTGQWYTWQGIHTASEVPKGHDYYKVACELTTDEAKALNAPDTAWNEGRVATARLKEECPVTSKTKAISFVYPESDANLIDWNGMAQEINQGTGAQAMAYPDKYDFLPGVTGNPNGQVAVLEWMQP
ncbi:MAG TPA: hypothetical protein VIM53_02565 [Candidatus Saccharimonadales bacterium]